MLIKNISYLCAIMTMCMGGVSLAPYEAKSNEIVRMHEIFWKIQTIRYALKTISIKYDLFSGQGAKELNSAIVCNIKDIIPKITEDSRKLNQFSLHAAGYDSCIQLSLLPLLLADMNSIQEIYQDILKNVSTFLIECTATIDNTKKQTLVKKIQLEISLNSSIQTKKDGVNMLRKIMSGLNNILLSFQEAVEPEVLKLPYNLPDIPA